MANSSIGTRTESQLVTFYLDLIRGEETASRTISFDIYKYDPGSIDEDVGSFRELLLGEYNKLIQPNNWRDSDISEEEWTTVGVRAKFTTRVDVEFKY